jgi:hypothetical protein
MKPRNRLTGGGDRPPALFLGFLACLVLVLGCLFYPSLAPNEIIFSNDNPLGAISARWYQPPACFVGLWDDMNVFGFAGGSLPVSPTYLTMWAIGPLLYAKFYVPLAIGFVGCAAWLCFRRLGLSPAACFLGGLAASLNSGFFSVACWGVIPQTVAFGMDFLAVAALAGVGRRPWLSLILAGMAVGLNVMEAADIGALFSLMIAAYVLYLAVQSEGSPVRGFTRGMGRTAVVALCAALIAAQAIYALVTTQIQGTAGLQMTKAKQWNWATQWSLPKRETLSLFVPGLFGYRLDTPDGGAYWGAMGQDAAWDDYFRNGRQGPPPKGNNQVLRQTGSGNYAGVLVVLVAIWAAAQALRKKESAFGMERRQQAWFWTGTGLISLLLAYGHHAPFYRLLYALPFSSNFRNPTKFLQVVDFALVMLFAYGVQGLVERHLQSAPGKPSSLKAWWRKASVFDRRWILGCAMAVSVGVCAWAVYSQSRGALEHYLQWVEFDRLTAQAIAAFSIRQAGWFVVLLALAGGLLAAIVAGRFMGRRPVWGVVMLAGLLLFDLMRANLPWIVYLDYQEKYEANEVTDFLSKQSYEHRVSVLPDWIVPWYRSLQPPGNAVDQIAAAEQYVHELYQVEWAQHHFLYYGIQSVDPIQMPRPPADIAAYMGALWFAVNSDNLHLAARYWQLTNTRYLLGVSRFLPLLNQGLDPGRGRFRVAATFLPKPKAGAENPDLLQFEKWTAKLATNGPFAVFEFTGALPRAGLYANWSVITNDQETLAALARKDFDPAQTVLVASPIAAPAAPAAGNAPAGTAEFKSYAPKRIVLQTQAGQASVLLLNDKYDKNWKVSVDGRPAPLLRCNFIMRGVQLPAGGHLVEMRNLPPVNALYVSIVAEICGLALLGVAVFGGKSKDRDPAKTREPR